MARVPPPGGSAGSGNGSAALFFDPHAFPAAVAGVARACDAMERAAEIMTPSVDPRAFGAAGAACLAFHRAWSAEVATGGSALEELVGALHVTGNTNIRADHG